MEVGQGSRKTLCRRSVRIFLRESIGKNEYCENHTLGSGKVPDVPEGVRPVTDGGDPERGSKRYKVSETRGKSRKTGERSEFRKRVRKGRRTWR